VDLYARPISGPLVWCCCTHTPTFHTVCRTWLLGIRSGNSADGSVDCGAGRRSIRAFCFSTAVVTFWVGGFDVLLRVSGLQFDTSFGLHSLPA